MAVLLKHQPWANSSEIESDSVEWNMWQRRLPPYHELEVGSRVVLVSGGGPSGGMLTWEVEVIELVRGWYGSHGRAWAMIRGGLRKGVAGAGLTRAGFLGSPYTAGKPGSGWLRAWSSLPVRRIMRPRPAGLAIGRHGWLVLDDVDLDDLLKEWRNGGSPGQGRLRDSARKAAVEWRAMEVTYAWLVAEGHREDQIRDTSSSCSYDFEVGPEDKPLLRVEVKGLSGPLGPVEITDGELSSARGPVETALVIVYGIRLSEDEDGQVVATGGTVHTEHPWRPAGASLTPVRYRYTPRTR